MENLSNLARIRDLTGISSPILAELRRIGGFPKPVFTCGRAEWWDTAVVIKWLRDSNDGGRDGKE